VKNGDFTLYNDLLLGILNYGLEFIDIEYHQNNLEFILKFLNVPKNSRVILSKHFNSSSELDTIKRVVYHMNNLNCDILKVCSC
jgi:3-dehydroquinate dehydratase